LGSEFVILPYSSQRYRIRLHWDLAALGPHAAAMSSFGDGDIDLPAGLASRVAEAYFMAGSDLHRYPKTISHGGFASVWLGSPPFDGARVMAWTQQLNSWYTRFFSGDPAQPYRVFMRFNPVNPGGGVEIPNSFVATFRRLDQGRRPAADTGPRDVAYLGAASAAGRVPDPVVH
jgi:hypothetical protein